MKKFQLLVIVMSLGVSGWVDAGTLLQAESNSVAHEIAVSDDASTNSFSTAGSYAFKVEAAQAQDFNFITVNMPFYVESARISHVPEPEGWVMMLMGAGFVVYQVRRRRKRASGSWDLH